MSGRSPGLKPRRGQENGGGQGSRCLLILQRCLAIQLQKVGVSKATANHQGQTGSEYWMYDSGYLLFQGFLEANLKCFWNASLLEAMKLLQFQGYVSPGVLLVSSSACALEVVRAAWSRNVLKPPNNYVIAVVGDIEDCLVQPLPQGQFTPLPEALCWVILDLTSSGEPAVLEKIRSTLGTTFPAIQRPSTEVVYDALAKLSADRKVYQTSQGYFVVTPERRRRDSINHQRRHSRHGDAQDMASLGAETRPLLMSPDEALTLVHGEMSTVRDGDVTHQSVQTNLADVICGGNPNDKILYARVAKRSSSFPSGRLERRHSLRFFGSSKRLGSPCRGGGGSMRHIASKHLIQSDSSSSTEYPSTDSTINPSPKKSSLLSRLFRRSKRAASVPPLATFSAQFPPPEWFNQRAVHLHSVGTQTNAATSNGLVDDLGRSTVSFAWTDDDGGFTSRATTLPRRHRRHDSGSSIANNPNLTHCTPRSSRRHRSPSSTLPRDTQSLCASRNSVIPYLVPNGSNFSPCKSSATTLSSERTQSSRASHKSPLQVPPEDRFERSGYRNSYRSTGSSIYVNGEQKSPRTPRASRGERPANPEPIYANGHDQRNPPRSAPKAKTTLVPVNKARTSFKAPEAPRNSSITLQVSTTSKQSPKDPVGDSPSRSVPSEAPMTSTTTTTTTFDGSNTKIFVQQQNSPVRSLITFDNGLKKSRNEDFGDVLIINEPEKSDKENVVTNGSIRRQKPRLERPTSLYSPREVIKYDSTKSETVQRFPSVESLGFSDITITNSTDSKSNVNGVLSPLDNPSAEKTMNNTRKLSNAMASGIAKDGLSYKNIFENQFGSKSNITSPDKTFDSTGSFNNLFVANAENKLSTQSSHDFSSSKTLDEVKERDLCTFPSLSDLTVNFKSIAAQKILQGISINSVDTLVEVNMAAAAAKPNNCDVTVHTDFGLV